MGKHLCRSLFFNKVAEGSITGFFPVNLAKFLRILNLPTTASEPRTYNTRSLETMTIAKNLETCHENKLRTMLRH